MINKDYYESFSHPKKCLLLSHSHPSGPPLLFVTFTYNLYSFVYGYESKDDSMNNYFKLTNRSCNNSIVFTTLMKDFRKIDLKITIYLIEYNNLLAHIEYSFYKGLRTGSYLIWDVDQIFAIHIRFNHDKKNHFEVSPYSSTEIESYLKSISKNEGELCLATENSAVVLKPEYEHKPDGFLNRFKAEFFHNGLLIGSRTYLAFICHLTQDYSNEIFAFIIDLPYSDISFKVVTMSLLNSILEFKEYKLRLPKAIFHNVENLANIPQNHKKVFIIKENKIIIECTDGTKRKIYLSRNRMIYYAKETKRLKVNSYMEYKRNIPRPLEAEC